MLCCCSVISDTVTPWTGLNPGLPHCRQILYYLGHQGRPRILGWVAYPFSRRSSWLRNRTRISALQADSWLAELPGKPFEEYVLCVCLVTQSCSTLCYPMDCSLPGSSAHGDSPGNNTGVGCHAFLQRIFPTQGLNPGLLHCRWILYCLSHQGRVQASYAKCPPVWIMWSILMIRSRLCILAEMT